MNMRILNSLTQYLTSFFIDREMRFIYRNNLKIDIKIFFTQLFYKNPNKDTKACSIYKTEKNYKIITTYPVSSGIFVTREPVFILPLNITLEELKNTIFKAINECKLISCKEYEKMPHSIKYYLNILKEKSLKGLYQNSTYCSIYLKNGILEIVPFKYSEKRKCLEPDCERNLKMEYSKENELKITNEVVQILNS